MSDLIHHITSRSAWHAALENGVYAPDSLANEGFIHCSKPSQILRVANDFYSGIPDLVMLEIDPGSLRPEMRWEPGTDKPDELFPHVFGPINLEAVSRVIELSPDPDGVFRRLPL